MYKELFEGMKSVTFISDTEHTLNECNRVCYFEELETDLSCCLKNKKAELSVRIKALSDPHSIIRVLPVTSHITILVNEHELFKVSSEHYLNFHNEFTPIDMAEAFTEFSFNKLRSVCKKKIIDCSGIQDKHIEKIKNKLVREQEKYILEHYYTSKMQYVSTRLLQGSIIPTRNGLIFEINHYPYIFSEDIDGAPCYLPIASPTKNMVTDKELAWINGYKQEIIDQMIKKSCSIISKCFEDFSFERTLDGKEIIIFARDTIAEWEYKNDNHLEECHKMYLPIVKFSTQEFFDYFTYDKENDSYIGDLPAFCRLMVEKHNQIKQFVNLFHLPRGVVPDDIGIRVLTNNVFETLIYNTDLMPEIKYYGDQKTLVDNNGNKKTSYLFDISGQKYGIELCNDSSKHIELFSIHLDSVTCSLGEFFRNEQAPTTCGWTAHVDSDRLISAWANKHCKALIKKGLALAEEYHKKPIITNYHI